MLRVEQLIENNTLKIKIPSIVEAIDTQRWLVNHPFQISEYQCEQINRIELTGNGKAIQGSLQGAFQVSIASKQLDINDEISLYNIGVYESDPDTGLLIINNKERGIEVDARYRNGSIIKAKTIYIENFDGQQIKNISYLTFQCNRLEKINLEALNLREVTHIDSLQSTVQLIQKDVNSSKTTPHILKELIKLGVVSKDCKSQSELFLQLGADEQSEPYEIDIYDTSIQSLHNITGLFRGCAGLTKVHNLGKITDKLKQKAVNADMLFESCNSLIEVPKELESLQLSQAASAFSYCLQLKEVPMLNIRHAETIDSMFIACRSLEKLIIDGNKDTRFRELDLVSMKAAFEISGLKEVVIKNVQFNKLENANFLFTSCTKLESVHIENVKFIGNKELILDRLFEQCKNLKRVTLKNIEIAQEVQLQNLFMRCTNLKTLNIENVSIHKIQQIHGILSNCEQLTEIQHSNLKIGGFSEELVEYKKIGLFSKINKYIYRFETGVITAQEEALDFIFKAVYIEKRLTPQMLLILDDAIQHIPKLGYEAQRESRISVLAKAIRHHGIKLELVQQGDEDSTIVITYPDGEVESLAMQLLAHKKKRFQSLIKQVNQ